MIHCDLRDSVALISLNRPDKRNALLPQMLADLDAAARAAAPTARALVLAGAGEVFCSGFDMKAVHADPTVLPALLRGLSTVIRTLRRLPIPVVIAAHGAAVAGGCALLGGGDIVVTNTAAKLGYPVLKLGISPAVTAPALRQLVGDGRARERTLDTDLVSGEEALRLGLAHVRVDLPEDVQPRAIRIAKELTQKGPQALAATKLLLSEIEQTQRDDPFDRALNASLALAGSPEQTARVAALWK